MRPVSFAAFAALCALGGAACTEPDTESIAADVVWMEWPAEAAARTPFDVRLGVWRPCALDQRFRPAAMADASSLTFTPYFVVSKQPIYCALTDVMTASLDVAPLDTMVEAPALEAVAARTYALRGAAPLPLGDGAGARTVRTFGEIVVRPAPGTDTRVMAGGFASAQLDGGCLRLRPGITFTGGYPIENPPDGSSFWSAFVRGYLHRPAVPVCGEAVAFHLESRE